MLKKISEFFDFISETNLIEEYFYAHKGKYPVYSGQTENNGIVAHISSYKQNFDCATTTTYGNAGKLFYRTKKYTIGRNCMGIKPKKEYMNQINMEWFSYKFQNLFYKTRIGDPCGQRSLNQTLIENKIIDIPIMSIQRNQLLNYKKLQKILNGITNANIEISKILESKLNCFSIKSKSTLKEIFDICGGNSNLTEQFIYNNQSTHKRSEIPILSSSTIQSNHMGVISKYAQFPNGTNLKIFSAPSILVTRNGFAGTMNYIDCGKFTTNDHAYVMTLKPQWLQRVNLEWFVFQYHELFKNLTTSKSDNATFSKEYAENQIIYFPSISYQNNIAKKLQAYNKLKFNLDNLKKNIIDLIEYDII